MNKEQLESLTRTIAIKQVRGIELEEIITDWFEQNPTKTAVVGFSDEQVYQVARRVCENGFDVGKTSIYEIVLIIYDYLKTQTFAQPKSFEPDWDDAPKEAEVLVLTPVWLNESRQRVGEITSQKFERPKPPAPVVEVGQEFKLRSICGYKVISVDGDIVKYEVEANGSKLVTERTLEDFLAKFERIGGE